MEKENSEKMRALEAALGQIEKQFGKGSVMKLGDFQAMNVEAIPTGALSLDIALGIGGIPRGRIRRSRSVLSVTDDTLRSIRRLWVRNGFARSHSRSFAERR